MDATSTPVTSLLILGILALIGGHSFALIRRGRWLALDPLNAFWGGVVMVYVVQPIQFGDVLARWHAPGVMDKTLGLSLFAFTFVVLGYEAGWGAKWARVVPAMPARLHAGRLLLVSALAVGLALVGYGYLIGTAGGFWEWVAVPRGGTNWAVVSSYIAMLTYLLPLGLALLLFRVNFWRAPLWATAVVWGLEGVLTLWSLYIGSRSQVIGCALAMLATYYLPRRRNPPAWLLASSFVVLFLVVSFIGAYRGYFSDLSLNLDQLDVDEVQQRILPGFLGGNARYQKREAATGIDFNCVMSVVELVPNEVDFNYGSCLLEFGTRPIPRSLWPDKHYPHYEAFTPICDRANLTSWVVPNSRQLILAGPAFTFVGHWFAVGGAVALAVAGFVTGCFFRLIRNLYHRAPASQGDKILYFFLMPIGFNEAAATPLFWVFNAGLFLLPLTGLLLLCGQLARVLPSAPRCGSGGAVQGGGGSARPVGRSGSALGPMTLAG